MRSMEHVPREVLTMLDKKETLRNLTTTQS